MTRNSRATAFIPIYLAGCASLAYILTLALGPGNDPALRRNMIDASRVMAAAATAIHDCRVQKGIPADPKSDPNGTGLIGIEASSITTSLGNLEAKRTTTNPDFAALLVLLFNEAGVRRGDAVAVGASSSFPALIMATLSAAQTMGLKPLVISSLGASEWGANDPSFSWLDMEACLDGAGLFETRPIAVAVGGDEDVGRNMSPAGREFLSRRIRKSGLPFFEETELRANVAIRFRFYREAAGGRPIKAFVNVGGSWANIGTNAEVLRLRPGLETNIFIPREEERGVLQAMAARGIPVIHLLNIKGLCERYGLPWDPRPLPLPGQSGFYRRAGGRTTIVILISAGYVAVMALVTVLLIKRNSFPGTSID